MRNEMAMSQQPAPLPTVTLRTIWHVDGDESYRITPRLMKPGGDTVALRTLDGVGEMLLSGESPLTLAKGTLLLVPKDHIEAYQVKYDRWHFYWFEFEGAGADALPMKRVLELPLAAGEEGELARCFDSLKVEKGRMAVLSQALFQYRLADWLARAGGQDGRIGGDELVLLLSQGVREGLSVRQLAQRACVCERTFRMLVRKYTGKSPKEYMLHDALDAALAMLRTTGLTVGEVAENTGFGNAFYFSRAFKKRFGIQPSKARGL